MQHGRRGKRPVFWVPAGFHPENTLPPRLLPHCQAAHYLMHRIIVRVAFGDRDGARLKMKYLQNTMGRHHCKPVLDALLDAGEIRRVGNYIEGVHSFGYLPREQYVTHRLRKFHPTDTRLLDRLEAVNQQMEAKSRPYRRPIHDVWERWQTRLGIDTRLARRIIAQMPCESNPYDVQTMLVERIRTHRHRFTVDAYGRVHNSITSLHRTLRPALRISGQPLGSVDIVNSQPALLALLIHQTDTPGTATSIYDRRFNPPLAGFSEYQRLATSGRLYDYLMEKTGLSRAEVKVGLLRDVFGRRRWYPSVVERAFRKSFPGVWSLVRRWNRNDHGALLKELQRVESDLVIQQVGSRLAPGGPFVSLHDSVFGRRVDLPKVESAFERQWEAIGFSLRLKTA